MTSGLLDPLQPEMIAGLFGRPSSIISATALARLQPRQRAAICSLTVLAMAITVIALQRTLIGKTGLPSPVPLMLHPRHAAGKISVALLQDPVGSIVLVFALASPVFCAAQVNYIAKFIPMNEANIGYRLSKLDIATINRETGSANKSYRLVGMKTTSALLLIASGAGSLLLDVMLYRHGLLASWNGSDSPGSIWRHHVYSGWWANPYRHPASSIALWTVGTYYFYFLQKQLAMGFIFSRYVRAVLPYEFGVAPNIKFNTDGYWGLRPLRYFMQWTYCSMLFDFILTLCVFIVWFPICPWTMLIEGCVVAINFTVVIYPSFLAQQGSILEKKLYVDHLIKSHTRRSERTAAIEAAWAMPNLPFHIRSTFTAATIYLLIPLLLAVVSSFLPR